MKNLVTHAALAALLAIGASGAFAQTSVQLDPAKSQVHFTVGAFAHTVHGTFKMRQGSIRFDPATGAASGAIVVECASGDSGSHSRDQKMSREVLECGKYPDVTFTARRVIGTVPTSGSGQIQVEGIFNIHGQDHPLTLPFTVQVSSSSVNASTNFQVPYVEWGMKNPGTFILTVNKTVDLKIDAVGTMTSAAPAR